MAKNILKQKLPAKEELDHSFKKRLEFLTEQKKLISELSVLEQNLLETMELQNLAKKVQNAWINETAKNRRKQLEEVESLQNELIENAKSKAADIQEKTLEIFGLTRDRVEAVGETIDKFLSNPITIMLGLLVLAARRFGQLDAAAGEFRVATGLARDNTKELDKLAENLSITYGNIGVQAEDVYNAATALEKSFGSTVGITKTNLELMIKLNKNWGVANEASAQYLQTLHAIGLTSGQVSKYTNDLLSMSKNYGVSAAAVMNDIQESFAEGYSYLSKYPEEFLKTAVRAHALGTTMGKVVGMMKGLLDFEQSINDEMEAAVLTGQNINLDQARYYALIGNTEKALDEVLKNVGSWEKFSKMLPLQQEALARAAGMTADELGKTLKLEHATQRVKQGIASAEEQELVNQQQMQDNMTKMKNAWTSIVTMVSSVMLPVMQALEPVFEGISWTVGILGKGITLLNQEFKNWVAYLLTGALALKLIALRFGVVSNLVTGLGAKIKGGLGTIFQKAFGGLGGGAKTMTDKASDLPGRSLTTFVKDMNPVKLIQAGAAMMIIAAALWVLAKALQQFSTGVTWDGLAFAATALIGLTVAMAVIAKISPIVLIGAAAFLVMAGAMWVLADALEKISNSSEGLLNLLTGLTSIDPLKLATLGGALGILGAGLTAFAGGAAIAGIVNSIFGGDTKESKQADKLDTVIEKLDMINASIDKMTPIIIEMDGKTVGKQISKAFSYG